VCPVDDADDNDRGQPGNTSAAGSTAAAVEEPSAATTEARSGVEKKGAGTEGGVAARASDGRHTGEGGQEKGGGKEKNKEQEVALHFLPLSPPPTPHLTSPARTSVPEQNLRGGPPCYGSRGNGPPSGVH